MQQVPKKVKNILKEASQGSGHRQDIGKRSEGGVSNWKAAATRRKECRYIGEKEKEFQY